jgi:hypothetical protein
MSIESAVNDRWVLRPDDVHDAELCVQQVGVTPRHGERWARGAEQVRRDQYPLRRPLRCRDDEHRRG